LLGLVVTVSLTVASELSYRHNEQRLLSLQAKLTALLLATAPAQIEATLARAAGVAAEAPDPVAAYRQAIAPSLAPRGPFASSTLAVVRDGHVRLLAHLGASPLRGLSSPQTRAVLAQAAKTSSLVTSRAVKGTVQRLGYLFSSRGRSGTFVVSLGQQLRTGYRVAVPRTNPDANLNIALYFGRSANPASLIETNVAHLPLDGTVSRETIAFGDNTLTLVASPRGSLAGSWSEYIPWVVLVGGVLISLLAALTTERLVRRRALAESTATVHREWYQRQRSISEDLQDSLLPKTLPSLPRVELAARYVAGARDTQIGGDWYSVVPVQENTFVFIVGDVSGHDIPAAGIMAALRHSTRALARLGLCPTEVLEHAGEEVDVGRDDHFATALVGAMNTLSHELTIASAGHLPPLMVRGDQAEYLNVPVGSPIGVPGDKREATVISLQPGTSLVVFTDGLVERRGEDIRGGLERLRASASAGPSSPEALIDHLVKDLVSIDNEDDVAVLVMNLLD
jgi:serine phosphatase RsbU (regulator of sigma subunit)